MWHWLLDFLLIVCLFLFMIDKLTFLWVRRCYDIFYSFVVYADGYLIFVDIDDFKSFNERFGHRTGDSILRKIGLILLRESYFRGFRYGGDELVVLLPWSKKKKANELAERVRLEVEKANIGGLGVTVSCAVVRHEEDASEFLRMAKRDGKNCVVFLET